MGRKQAFLSGHHKEDVYSPSYLILSGQLFPESPVLRELEGKDTHPAAFAVLQNVVFFFFKPPFPLRKFPICLCAGLAWCGGPVGVETAADVRADWEAHSCMSGPCDHARIRG